MLEISATIAIIILAGLTLFQLALILGAPIGRYAWGGAHDVLPTNLKIGSITSVVLYAVFAIIILSKAEIITLLNSHPITNIGIWVLAVYFTVGILLNGMSRSKPERNLMTPVAFLLAITTTVIAII